MKDILGNGQHLQEGLNPSETNIPSLPSEFYMEGKSINLSKEGDGISQTQVAPIIQESTFLDVLKKTHVIDYSKISQQVSDVTDAIVTNREVNWNRYRQVSPEAREFLTTYITHTPPEMIHELPVILSHLLLSPSFQEQEKVLSSTSPILELESTPEGEREMRRFIPEVIDILLNRENDWALMKYFASPTNRDENRSIFTGVMQRCADRYNLTRNLDIVQGFFTLYPQNQVDFKDIFTNVIHESKIKGVGKKLIELAASMSEGADKSELIQAALDDYSKNENWESIVGFFTRNEGFYGKKHVLDTALARLQERNRKQWKEIKNDHKGLDEWVDAKNTLTSFFQNPRNQEMYPEILHEVINIDLKDKYLGNILKLFSQPESQRGETRAFVDGVLTKIIKKNQQADLSELTAFFSQEGNRKGRDGLFDAVLKLAKRKGRGDPILYMLHDPSTQQGREELIIDTLTNMEASMRKNQFTDYAVNILNFFNEPTQQQSLAEFLERKKREQSQRLQSGSIGITRLFQKEKLMIRNRQELIESAFKYLQEDPYRRERITPYLDTPLAQYIPDKESASLQAAYRLNPAEKVFKNSSVINKEIADDVFDKLSKSAAKISDETLRNEYLNNCKTYLHNPDASLSFVLLETNDNLPLLLNGVMVGIDPLVIKSWNLSHSDKDALLPLFINLAKTHANLLDGLHLPFKPRIDAQIQDAKNKNLPRSERVIAEFNPQLIQWFTFVNSLASLPLELKGEEVLENHLQILRNIQQAHNVSDTELNLSLPFLIQTQREIQRVHDETFTRLMDVMGITEKISLEQFKQFSESWNGEINSFIFLASHYQNLYTQGLPLLGNITELIFNNTFREERYNITKDLTRRQLSPILDKVPKGEEEKVLKIWEDDHAMVSKVDTSTFIHEKPNMDELRNLLNHQLAPYEVIIGGDNHIDELMHREELSLSEEERIYVKESILTFVKGNKTSMGFNDFKRQFTSSEVSPQRIQLLFGLVGFYRDFYTTSKTQIQLSSTLNRLLPKIQQQWRELYNLQMINGDLSYLQSVLQPEEIEREEVVTTRMFMSLFSDHPKTLLEIGKYPYSSSCQNYESTGYHNTCLPGYVFDSHIKALTVVEVSINDRLKQLSEDELSHSTKKIDEGKREMEFILTSGEPIRIYCTQ